jgi:hypothetical protein
MPHARLREAFRRCIVGDSSLGSTVMLTGGKHLTEEAPLIVDWHNDELVAILHFVQHDMVYLDC